MRIYVGFAELLDKRTKDSASGSSPCIPGILSPSDPVARPAVPMAVIRIGNDLPPSA